MACFQNRRLKMDSSDKLKKMNILLIDDDELIRAALCIIFEMKGWHLITLKTAEDAIELLKNQTYEIIITDYRLPGMDGLTFFKQIQEYHPYAMKILITAYFSEEVVSEANRLGIYDLIQKPFTMKVIEETLYHLIKRDESENRQRTIQAG